MGTWDQGLKYCFYFRLFLLLNPVLHTLVHFFLLLPDAAVGWDISPLGKFTFQLAGEVV